MALLEKIEFMDDEEVLKLLRYTVDYSLIHIGEFDSVEDISIVLHKCFDQAEYWQRRAVWSLVAAGSFIKTKSGKLVFMNPDVAMAAEIYFEDNVNKIYVEPPITSFIDN